MGKFVIDAIWIGEVVRQGLFLARDFHLITASDDLLMRTVQFASLIITGLVAMRTASARVLDNAGTSVEQVKAVAANPNAQMVAIVDGRRQS